MSVDYSSLDDFDFDDDSTDKDTLKEIRQIQSDIVEKLDKIEKLLTNDEQVSNLQVPKGKAGRRKLKMYYENRLVHDSDLIHLISEMGLTVSEILNDFCYVNDRGIRITDRTKCRNLIAQRLYIARRNTL